MRDFGVPSWCAVLVCRFAGRFFGRGSVSMMELQSSGGTVEACRISQQRLSYKVVVAVADILLARYPLKMNTAYLVPPFEVFIQHISLWWK